MIKNVIFDMGNVLVDFCWEKDLKERGFEGELFERIANATVRNEDWNEFDLANLTHEEIIQNFVDNDPELENEIRFVTEDISGMIKKKPYAEDLINRLHIAGYKVYLLSNFSYEAFTQAADELTYIPLADGAVFSCDVHMIKPYPDIYNHLLSKYNLNAPECVFLDDVERNVEGAEACGIRGIIFKDLEDATYKLNCMGVKF